MCPNGHLQKHYEEVFITSLDLCFVLLTLKYSASHFCPLSVSKPGGVLAPRHTVHEIKPRLGACVWRCHIDWHKRQAFLSRWHDAVLEMYHQADRPAAGQLVKSTPTPTQGPDIHLCPNMDIISGEVMNVGKGKYNLGRRGCGGGETSRVCTIDWCWAITSSLEGQIYKLPSSRAPWSEWFSRVCYCRRLCINVWAAWSMDPSLMWAHKSYKSVKKKKERKKDDIISKSVRQRRWCPEDKPLSLGLLWPNSDQPVIFLGKCSHISVLQIWALQPKGTWSMKQVCKWIQDLNQINHRPAVLI